MPSMVLGNCCQAPLRPTRASRVCEPTSTPQMTSVTVTCLVDATGNRATVRSCVTPRPRLVPRLPCGYGLGGRGRQPPRTGSGGHRIPCSTIVADPTCRGPDTRGPAAGTAAGPGRPQAGQGPLADHAALELGQGGEEVKHQLAAGRSGDRAEH